MNSKRNLPISKAERSQIRKLMVLYMAEHGTSKRSMSAEAFANLVTDTVGTEMSKTVIAGFSADEVATGQDYVRAIRTFLIEAKYVDEVFFENRNDGFVIALAYDRWLNKDADLRLNAKERDISYKCGPQRANLALNCRQNAGNIWRVTATLQTNKVPSEIAFQLQGYGAISAATIPTVLHEPISRAVFQLTLPSADLFPDELGLEPNGEATKGFITQLCGAPLLPLGSPLSLASPVLGASK